MNVIGKCGHNTRTSAGTMVIPLRRSTNLRPADLCAPLTASLSNPGEPFQLLIRAVASADQWPDQEPQPRQDDPSVATTVKENRKLSPTEVAEVVARYKAGATLRSLSKAFGMHEQTVRAHLKRSGVTLRSKRALDTTQQDDAIRLYVDEVWTLAELAAKYGVAPNSIRAMLIRRGVQLRPRGRR